MEKLELAKRTAADVHWLATLLTGRPDIASDVTVKAFAPSDDNNAPFSSWMHRWSRRIVIANALAAIHSELDRSARRTAKKRAETSELPPPSWVLDAATTKKDLEGALLPIDVFPRAAVVLLVFERVPMEDAAVLLNSEPDLVRKGLEAGLVELTINLARMQGWTSGAAQSHSLVTRRQHV